MSDSEGILNVVVLASVVFGSLFFFSGGFLIGIGLFFVALITAVPLMGGTPESGEEAEPGVPAGDTERVDEALAALRRRYARGELSDEQFEQKLDHLLGTETVEDAEEFVRDTGDPEVEREGRGG